MVDLFAPLQTLPEAERRHISKGYTLRDYQVRAAYKIFTGELAVNPANGVKQGPDRDGVAVHIDMGLGKTIIGLTAIAEWFAHGVCKKPVLVVAPIPVCESVWRQEAASWTHTKHLKFQLIRGTEKERVYAIRRDAHVMLINPELLQWLQTHIRGQWGEWFDALIIDESSMFKDHRAKRFRVLSNYGTKQLVKGANGKPFVCPLTGATTIIPPHRFKRSAVLTGTPSPSGLQNLWAPMYLLDHGARLHKKFDTFQGRYFHKTKQVAAHVHKYALNDEEDEVRPEWQVATGGAERIHEKIADITIELNAADYGVLPKQLPPIKHFVQLPEELKQHYRSLEREAVLEMLKDPIVAANGGAKSNLCWQMCQGAVYHTDEFGKKDWSEVHTAKLDKLVELVDTLNQNCLIPYHYQHDLERVTARFKKEGIAYAVLKGKNRQNIIDRWNAGEIPNLLIHPQSAGHGLNLQFGGHTLIWFATIWSLERYLQTNARVARSGQTGIVSVHHILTEHTTDLVRFNSLFEHGDDQDRFRKATLAYQKMMGLDIGSMAMPNVFEGIDL